MSRQRKGMSGVAAAAEKVRAASVQDDAQIAVMRGGTTAAAVGRLKAFYGLASTASAAELEAAEREYWMNGPGEEAPAEEREGWARVWAAVAQGTCTAPVANPPAGTAAHAILANSPAWSEMVDRTRRARDSAASASTPAAPPPAGLVKRDPDTGAMSYLDAPVQMTSSGDPAVATQNGWMSVSAAAAAGLTAQDLQLPYEMARFAPTGPSARMLQDGPR